MIGTSRKGAGHAQGGREGDSDDDSHPPVQPAPLSSLTRAVVLSCAIGGMAAANAQGVLRMSAIPEEAPSELLRKFTPMGKYLESQLGMKIEWTPLNDYPAVVEALASRKVDLAWLGGVTFVQLRLRTGNAIPLVQRVEDERFVSRVIVNAAAGINTIADLKGKEFAFGSVSSTSGHLMPRYYLMQNGIDPAKDFKRIAFAGAHDATAAWVESGRVPAGALDTTVWDRLVREKKVDTGKVKVLYTTPGFHNYNWTVHGDMDAALVKRITEAFLRLNPANPQHKELLDLQRGSRYIRTKIENYKAIEIVGREIGIIK